MQKAESGITTRWLIAVAVVLLSIPLMRMTLAIKSLPSLLSDYSWGMMARLGLCFAPVVLMWAWAYRGVRIDWRSALFVVACVISADGAYAAQFLVPKNFFILSIVVTGGILLSLAQKLLLDYSWTHMLAASVAAPGLFYLITYSAHFFPTIHEMISEYWPYYWQVGYLLGMFVLADFFPAASDF